jgi:CheB methylesterase
MVTKPKLTVPFQRALIIIYRRRRTRRATHGSDGTAIVLSGADSDGALGIKRIKENGGLTVAQEPGRRSTTECRSLRLLPEWWTG